MKTPLVGAIFKIQAKKKKEEVLHTKGILCSSDCIIEMNVTNFKEKKNRFFS